MKMACGCVLALSAWAAGAQEAVPSLIVRADDMGSFRSANIACMEAFEKGIETSIEVMVVTPWFPEAARLLRENPGIDVGLHLTITSEWDNIKWRPLTSCPSLVDSNGYFFPMMTANPNYPGLAIKENKWNIDEVERELVAIRNLGFRNVLLVAAENPKLVSSGYMESVIRLARSMVPSVSIEIAPSRVVDYKKYVDAGCEGLTVFQETYDEKVYPTLHPSGPKSVFEWRLATPERGAQAGMRKLGLGPLLGVNEWRFEVLAVALHAKFLFKRAWKSQISISLPRMRPAASGYIPEPGNIPNDRQTVQVICALRMFLPRLAIVVSTRESRKFRDGVMGLGGTMMSAFSSTKPGGYADREESGEQFHIDDSRNPEEFAEALRKRGIDPVWKDYDSALGA